MTGPRSGGTEGRAVLVAILLFLGVAIWLSLQSPASKEYQPPYSTYTSNRAGLRGLYELLERRGDQVDRFSLSEHEYPADSVVVIADETAINPFKAISNPLDIKAMELFMRRGGSLVIFCDDDMQLLREFDELFRGELLAGQLDPLSRDPASIAVTGASGRGGGTATWRGAMNGQLYDFSTAQPPLLEGIASIEAADTYTTAEHELSPLVSLEDSFRKGEFKLLVGYRHVGSGELILVNRPEIVTNGWIERADNHRLALALIEGAARGRPIHFDEHIHGFTAARMTAGGLLARTPGGHLLLLAILCIIVLFIGQAIMPARYLPRPAPARRQSAEMVLGQASLFQRAGFESGSLRHIVDGLKHELMKSRDFGRLPEDAELLMWARDRMPAGWHMEPLLEEYLQGRQVNLGRSGLQRASQCCDAMRMRIWQRPLG